jgi:hypothetical protein
MKHDLCGVCIGGLSFLPSAGSRCAGGAAASRVTVSVATQACQPHHLGTDAEFSAHIPGQSLTPILANNLGDVLFNMALTKELRRSRLTSSGT